MGGGFAASKDIIDSPPFADAACRSKEDIPKLYPYLEEPDIAGPSPTPRGVLKRSPFPSRGREGTAVGDFERHRVTATE